MVWHIHTWRRYLYKRIKDTWEILVISDKPLCGPKLLVNLRSTSRKIIKVCRLDIQAELNIVKIFNVPLNVKLVVFCLHFTLSYCLATPPNSCIK